MPMHLGVEAEVVTEPSAPSNSDSAECEVRDRYFADWIFTSGDVAASGIPDFKFCGPRQKSK